MVFGELELCVYSYGGEGGSVSLACGWILAEAFRSPLWACHGGQVPFESFLGLLRGLGVIFFGIVYECIFWSGYLEWGV